MKAPENLADGWNIVTVMPCAWCAQTFPYAVALHHDGHVVLAVCSTTCAREIHQRIAETLA